MSAFKFRLEKVLKVREIMEEKAKHSWGFEMRLLQEKRNRLLLLEQEKRDIREFGYRQTDLRLRQAMYDYLQFLNQRIETQINVVQEQERLAERAKGVWLTARRETKKVSTLRDKQHAEFVKNEKRKEQKILDDMRSNVQVLE